MANNLGQDMTAALGATPPGTPTQVTAFRTNRTALRAALATLFATQQPVPQAPIQQAPAVVPVRPATPIRGGLMVDIDNKIIPWVGGGTTATTRVTQPASSLAYRTHDLSLSLKVEKACIQGLPENLR
jgi:hypothetical protein